MSCSIYRSINSKAKSMINFFNGISNLEERISKIESHINEFETIDYLPKEYKIAYVFELNKYLDELKVEIKI